MQVVGLAVLVAVLVGMWVYPANALRVLWFACIPVAPMVLLVAPNLWVSVCPISTLQQIPKRVVAERRRARVAPELSRNLQLIGWIVMFVGIPTRHLLFNSDAAAVFWVASTLGLVAVVVGATTSSLSGWCVGVCPVRPIEVVYGQFAVDRHRPERCTTCTGCVPHCMRLAPRTGGGELEREPLAGRLTYGLPGFVAAYFALDLLGLCTTEHRYFVDGVAVGWSGARHAGLVYGVMAAGFLVSYVACAGLRRQGVPAASVLRGAAIGAYCAYYAGVAPEIVEVWGLSSWWIAPILVLPAAALLFALGHARSSRLARLDESAPARGDR